MSKRDDGYSKGCRGPTVHFLIWGLKGTERRWRARRERAALRFWRCERAGGGRGGAGGQRGAAAIHFMAGRKVRSGEEMKRGGKKKS